MNYRTMFMINAIVVAVFGVMFIAVPEFSLKFFNVETYVSSQMLMRFLGGSMIVSAVFLWLLQELQSKHKVIAGTLMAASIVGFVLTILGMVSDKVIREYGWLLLVIHILFALAYAYLVFGVTVTVNNKK